MALMQHQDTTPRPLPATAFLDDAIRYLTAAAADLCNQCDDLQPQWLCAQIEHLIDDTRRVRAALAVPSP